MKKRKLLSLILVVLAAAALFSLPVFAQEEDEPAPTGTLLVPSQSGQEEVSAEYVYTTGEEETGVEITADGKNVKAIVEGDIFSFFGGVSASIRNNGSATLESGTIQGNFGITAYLDGGSFTADTEGIYAGDGTALEITLKDDGKVTVTAGDISSDSYGVTIETGVELENIDYDDEFIEPETPDPDSDGWDEFDDMDEENDDESTSEYDGKFLSSEEDMSFDTSDADEDLPLAMTGTAGVRIAKADAGAGDIVVSAGSIDAGDTAVDIDLLHDKTVSVTIEDSIFSNNIGVDVQMSENGGNTVISAPVINAENIGISVYAPAGTVTLTNEMNVSGESAIEATNEGGTISLKNGIVEGQAGLKIEATGGATTAETEDIDAGNYGVYVHTFDPADYEPYDPDAGDGGSESAGSETASGEPVVTVTVDGDITDYIAYEAPDQDIDVYPDPDSTAETQSFGKDAGGDLNDTDPDEKDYTAQDSTGIIIEAETESTVDITVKGGIDMTYGNEIEAYDNSKVNVTVEEEINTFYGNRISAYDGAVTDITFGAEINAGGKALDTVAYSGEVRITAAGDVNVTEGEDNEDAAGIYADSAGTGKTTIDVTGGISVKSNLDENTAYGISAENTGGEISIAIGKDVAAEGIDAVGLEIINEPENEIADGEAEADDNVSIRTAVEINGNLTGSAKGLTLKTSDADNIVTDVLVTETISGKQKSVEVDENANPENFDLTVWEIVKPNGNAAEYADGTAAEDIEKSIKYIIRIDPDSQDKITVTDAYGSALELSHGYPIAKENAVIYVKSLDGEELNSVTNGKTQKTALSKDAEGNFFLNVPKGGAVWLAAGPQPSPRPEPRPEPTFHRLEDILWLRGGTLPATGFSTGKVTPLADKPMGIGYRPTGLTIQIPSIDVSEPILTVPYENGLYPVDWLDKNVGLLEKSSLPGKGITVLTGHNHVNTTETGPFLFIRDLEQNARVLITDEANNIRMYRVYGNYKIPADQIDGVDSYLRDNALVLITCEDESEEGGYLNRRVVLAEPM